MFKIFILLIIWESLSMTSEPYSQLDLNLWP